MTDAAQTDPTGTPARVPVTPPHTGDAEIDAAVSGLAAAADEQDGSVLDAGRTLLAVLHQRLDRLEQS